MNPSDPKLATSMTEAWMMRATQARNLILTARHAPALFKPEAVEEAHREYEKATSEIDRWSA